MEKLFCLFLVVTLSNADVCEDVDTALCSMISSKIPDMCGNSCLNQLCRRSCGLCPLRCYACHETADASNCTTVTTCPDINDYCFTVQSFTDRFDETYKLGCARQSTCLQYSSISTRRGVKVDAGCCNTDMCNNNPPSLLSFTQTQPVSSTVVPTLDGAVLCEDVSSDICSRLKSLVNDTCSKECVATQLCPNMCGRCYNCVNCKEISSPHDCNDTIPCVSGKECFAYETLTDSGKIAINLGCTEKQVCQMMTSSTSHMFGKRQESFSFKGGCCTGERCNVDMPSSTTPTVPPTTTGPDCRHFDGDCPDEYTHIRNHCYKIIGGPLTFEDSKIACSGFCGNQLAEFDDMQEYYDVMQHFKSQHQRDELNLYVGAHQDGSNWKWAHNQNEVDSRLFVSDGHTGAGQCVISTFGYRRLGFLSFQHEGLVEVSCQEKHRPLCQVPVHNLN